MEYTRGADFSRYGRPVSDSDFVRLRLNDWTEVRVTQVPVWFIPVTAHTEDIWVAEWEQTGPAGDISGYAAGTWKRRQYRPFAPFCLRRPGIYYFGSYSASAIIYKRIDAAEMDEPTARYITGFSSDGVPRSGGISARDPGALWFTDVGGGILHGATVTHTSVTAGATTTAALAANASRLAALLVNDSGEPIYVKIGASAVMNAGIRINADGGSLEINGAVPSRAAINCISSSGTAVLLVSEWT